MFNLDEVYSVSDFLNLCRNSVEQNIPHCWVQGEISNLSRPSSGHWYFSLKDSKGQIRCAFFRLNQRKVQFSPENGMSVVIRGAPTLYELRGDFQLIVQQMEPAGIGNLQIAFDQLKNKLKAEGLFDAKNKKNIPVSPETIGVISSSSGAVIRDIIHVLKTRYPFSNILLYDTIVQGEDAYKKIIKALRIADSDKRCDVLILARGGGSMEDLWPFNEEELAREIFACTTPIISSIGHETDTTIADFVADVRAPTPSAAAVIATPDRLAIINQATKLRKQLQDSVNQSLDKIKLSLELLQVRIIDPSQQLQRNAQKLDEYEFRLVRQIKRAHQLYQSQLQQLNIRLRNNAEYFLKDQANQFSNKVNRLNLLSPLNTLSRGYSITHDKDGKVLLSSKKINLGDLISSQLHDGKVTSKVLKKEDN